MNKVRRVGSSEKHEPTMKNPSTRHKQTKKEFDGSFEVPVDIMENGPLKPFFPDTDESYDMAFTNVNGTHHKALEKKRRLQSGAEAILKHSNTMTGDRQVSNSFLSASQKPIPSKLAATKMSEIYSKRPIQPTTTVKHKLIQ